MPLFSATKTRPFAATSTSVGLTRLRICVFCWKPGGRITAAADDGSSTRPAIVASKQRRAILPGSSTVLLDQESGGTPPANPGGSRLAGEAPRRAALCELLVAHAGD